MDEQASVSITVLQLLLGALGLTGAGGGILSAWTAHQNRKAQVSGDERKAKADREAQLQAITRMQADYIHGLRGQVMAMGGVPLPWPEGLAHI